MAEKTVITDLDADAMSHIMLRVARSPDGATSFARALSVSKAFREFGNNPQLLESVRFEIRDYPKSFWGINGLLTKCARAQNLQARAILLVHLTARTEVLTKISKRSAEAAVLEEETRVAHLAVGTRGRKRAADSAKEEHERLSMHVEREGEEIMKHIRVVLSRDN